MHHAIEEAACFLFAYSIHQPWSSIDGGLDAILPDIGIIADADISITRVRFRFIVLSIRARVLSACRGIFAPLLEEKRNRGRMTLVAQ